MLKECVFAAMKGVLIGSALFLALAILEGCVPRAYDAVGAAGYGLSDEALITALAAPSAPCCMSPFRPMPVVPSWTNYRTGQMWFGSLP